ncbi:MAG: hypothetical protein H8D56_11255 [Planctomycetes bacterium]|nr:hypothetical protein [Planctomycetota bacterium]MBL7142932.1 hypothetical protein [Phycisphaerae bacterium]
MSRFIKTCALCVMLLGYLCCSGCATILGGIIGYQSGELAAGLAIGAALDFGGDIVNGVGQLLTDKEVRYEQKVTLDTEDGKIELAKSDFSAEKMEKLMRKLEKKFEQNGWSYTMVQKKRHTERILLSEKWRCKDSDGKEFELSILRERHKDTQISIEPTDEDAPGKHAITIKVYNWLKEAAIGSN